MVEQRRRYGEEVSMKYCAHPSCPTMVIKGRCQFHEKAKDQERGTAQERGYDYLWANYSKNFRQEHPICGERADGSLDATYSRCVQRGITTPADVVDHTIPMSQGGSKWNPANHMSACFACNTWKAQTLEKESHAIR